MSEVELYSELSLILSAFGWIIPVFVVFGIILQLRNFQLACDSRGFLYFAALYLVVLFTIFPSGDKINYSYAYDSLQMGTFVSEGKDWIFYFVARCIGIVTNWNLWAWFSFISVVYVGGYVFFVCKCFPKSALPISLSFFVAHGFFSYGVNTIRAGFGMVLTEAAAHGCVPIAFNSYTAVQDIIENGVDGFLVTPFDCNEYADKIARVLDDDSLFQAISRNAVGKMEKFSVKTVGKMWDALIKEVCA